MSVFLIRSLCVHPFTALREGTGTLFYCMRVVFLTFNEDTVKRYLDRYSFVCLILLCFPVLCLEVLVQV